MWRVCRASAARGAGRRLGTRAAPVDDSTGKHVKRYNINATGRRSAVVAVTDTGHTLRTDVPEVMGGGDEAPQPVETLLTALVGCAQATALFVGRMMKPRLDIEKIEFSITAHRDQRGALQRPIETTPQIPARLTAVSGHARVFLKSGAVVPPGALHILGEQTEARCPVANMMAASGCAMDIRWLDGVTDLCEGLSRPPGEAI